MINKGWIKLHRSFLNWEWWSSSKHVALYIHLILTANYKETKWRGEIIKIGEVLTGLPRLSKATGLSIQNIRTVLNDLKSTQEITVRVTSKFRVITLINYSKYQIINDGLTDELTVNQQTTNRQLTTSNNNKEYKEDIYTQSKEIIEYLNLKANTNYKSNKGNANIELIMVRLQSKQYNKADMITVIDNMCSNWLHTEYEQYLRPSTLFKASKIDNYINMGIKTSPSIKTNSNNPISTSNNYDSRKKYIKVIN